MSKKVEDETQRKEIEADIMKVINLTIKKLQNLSDDNNRGRQAVLAFLEGVLQPPAALLENYIDVIGLADAMCRRLYRLGLTVQFKSAFEYFKHALNEIGKLHESEGPLNENWLAIISTARRVLINQVLLHYARNTAIWERIRNRWENRLMQLSAVLFPRRRQPWYKRLFSWARRKKELNLLKIVVPDVDKVRNYFQQHPEPPSDAEEEHDEL